MDRFQEEYFKSQPFFAVSDDAYERMHEQLMNGASFVKTYLHRCPNAYDKSKCNCIFFKNVLNNDNHIVRIFGGKVKPVYSFSELRTLEGMPSRDVSTSTTTNSNSSSSTTTRTAAVNSTTTPVEPCPIEPGHMLGHGSSDRRPQDAHIVTPADIHAERSGINPPGTIDQKLHEQKVFESKENFLEKEEIYRPRPTININRVL